MKDPTERYAQTRDYYGRPILGNRILTPIRPYKKITPRFLINRFQDPPTIKYEWDGGYGTAAAAEQY